MKEEIWKDVVGYEGLYKVSNLGRVKRLETQAKPGQGNYYRPESIVRYGHSKTGYIRVRLRNGTQQKNHSMHRLVAEAFISNPENKPQVHHINHIRDDNRVENLAWASLRDHRDEHWLSKMRENGGATRKPITINGTTYISQSEALRELDINHNTLINAVRDGKTVFQSKGNVYKLSVEMETEYV